MNLISGCSYTESWKSFDGVNLSRSGFGLDRSIRTIMEYTISNPSKKPHAILLQLSYADRMDIRTLLPGEDIEGPYVADRELCHQVLKESVSSYLQWDRMFTQLIAFTGWLRWQGINYLVWDQCNQFDIHMITEFRGMRKLGYLTSDPNVINLFGFCGNKFLADSGCSYTGNPVQYHYSDRDLETVLKPQLQKYINDKNLGIQL